MSPSEFLQGDNLEIELNRLPASDLTRKATLATIGDILTLSHRVATSQNVAMIGR